jgi:addiction module RelE/StbE family toxin
MKYEIVITGPADADISDIALYISNELHSPQAAVNLLDDIDRHILDLEHMPKKYALVQDERLSDQRIRIIPVKNYLVFYSINDNSKTITIIRVLYNKRDWVKIL